MTMQESSRVNELVEQLEKFIPSTYEINASYKMGNIEIVSDDDMFHGIIIQKIIPLLQGNELFYLKSGELKMKLVIF